MHVEHQGSKLAQENSSEICFKTTRVIIIITCVVLKHTL